MLKPIPFHGRSAAEDDDDSFVNEYDKLCERIEDIIAFGEGETEMYPEIMRTNKMIHKEAAAVLYGDNWFAWSLDGLTYQPMWTWPNLEKHYCPRRYSRLITKMSLVVSVTGDENAYEAEDAIHWVTLNVSHACKTSVNEGATGLNLISILVPRQHTHFSNICSEIESRDRGT